MVQKKLLLPLLLLLLLAFSVTAVYNETGNYRIETVKETSGWNSQGYEHIVDYEWKGGSPLVKDYCMRFPVSLGAGSTAELLDLTPKTNSFSVDILNSTAIGDNTGSCGRANNKWRTHTNASGTFNESYCYDNSVAITDGFRLEWDEVIPHQEWVDVSGSFQYHNFGGNNYYCVEEVTWQAGETKTVRYRYNVEGDVKWDALFGNLTALTLDLVLDPFTNSSLYEADFTIDNSTSEAFIVNGTVLDTTTELNLTHYVSFDTADFNFTSNRTFDPYFLFNYTAQNAEPNQTGAAANTGESFRFNGTGANNSFLDSPHRLNASVNISMAIWAKIDEGVTANRYFISQFNGGGDRGIVFQLSNSGDLVLNIATSSGSSWAIQCSSATSHDLETWNHYAMVREDDEVRLFVNGSSFHNCTGQTAAAYRGTAQDDFAFASDSNDPNTLAGSLDEAFIAVGRSWTAHEVALLYNNGLGAQDPIGAAGDFVSNTIPATINVTEFTPSWSGTTSNQPFVSFDGGSNYAVAVNGLLQNWNESTGDSLLWNVSLDSGDTFTDFTMTVAEAAPPVVNNSVPTLTTPSVNPVSPEFNDHINWNVTYVDADGDVGNVTFVHYVNGSIVFNETITSVPNSTTVGSTLVTSNFGASALVEVNVTATDGENTSALVKNSVVISAVIPVVGNYTPTYEADDIPAIAVDGIGLFLFMFVGMMGFLAFVVFVVWAIRKLTKNKDFKL